MMYRGWLFQTIEKQDGVKIYKAIKDREAIIGTKEEIKHNIDLQELEAYRKENGGLKK